MSEDDNRDEKEHKFDALNFIVIVQDEVFNVGDEEDELTFTLPRHERCKSHTLSLIATTDAKKAKLSMMHKRVMESAMAKASRL